MASALAEEEDIPIIHKFLGKGFTGLAFLSDDGRVVKIMMSKSSRKSTGDEFGLTGIGTLSKNNQKHFVKYDSVTFFTKRALRRQFERNPKLEAEVSKLRFFDEFSHVKCIVMPLVGRVLPADELTIPRLKEMMCQIIPPMRELNAKGWIHTDLTVRNVSWDEVSKRWVIIDYDVMGRKGSRKSGLDVSMVSSFSMIGLERMWDEMKDGISVDDDYRIRDAMKTALRIPERFQKTAYLTLAYGVVMHPRETWKLYKTIPWEIFELSQQFMFPRRTTQFAVDARSGQSEIDRRPEMESLGACRVRVKNVGNN